MTTSIFSTPWREGPGPLDAYLGASREGRIPCPRRGVVWQRIAWDWVGPPQTVLLVRRTDGVTSYYCAELDADTPYFLEVRDGAPPVRLEGELGPLLTQLDLDGEVMTDRADAEPVLYGEAPDEVLVVAELSLDAGAWTVERVT